MYWGGAGDDDKEGEEEGTVILFHLHWQCFSNIFFVSVTQMLFQRYFCCFSDTDVFSMTHAVVSVSQMLFQ